MSTGRPPLKAALVSLFERWPRSASFDELRDEVRSRLGRAEGDLPEFAEGLLQAHISHLITLHAHEPRIAAKASERPLASALARFQASGDSIVTSLRLRSVDLAEFDALVLRLLDGTRDRAAILDGLVAFAADGTLEIEQDDGPVTDPERLRTLLAPGIAPSLARIARHALLVEN